MFFFYNLHFLHTSFMCSFTQPPMRRMRICFTDFFSVFFCFFCFFFVFFPFATKYQTTVLGNGWTDFHETFTSGHNVVSNVVPKCPPPINFLGTKNYTLRTWWWRLASDWELVCWLWHCAATAVALKRHERVNAFNLVKKIYPHIYLSI